MAGVHDARLDAATRCSRWDVNRRRRCAAAGKQWPGRANFSAARIRSNRSNFERRQLPARASRYSQIASVRQTNGLPCVGGPSLGLIERRRQAKVSWLHRSAALVGLRPHHVLLTPTGEELVYLLRINMRFRTGNVTNTNA